MWVVLKRACDNLGISYTTQLRKIEVKPWATTADTTVVAADGKARKMVCLRLDCVPMWLVLKRACRNLGVSLQSQLAKLDTKQWATVRDFLMVGADGKRREMVCLHLDCVPMWLATIETGKDGGAVWVVLKRACKNLGISESPQRHKLQSKPWATASMISAVADDGKAWAVISITDTTGPDGKRYEMVCLHLDCVSMWLVLKRACRNLGVSLQGQLAKLDAKPWATVKDFFTVGADSKA